MAQTVKHVKGSRVSHLFSEGVGLVRNFRLERLKPTLVMEVASMLTLRSDSAIDFQIKQEVHST